MCTYARDHACGRAPGEKGQVCRSAMSTAAIVKKYMHEFQRERGVGWTHGKVRARVASGVLRRPCRRASDVCPPPPADASLCDSSPHFSNSWRNASPMSSTGTPGIKPTTSCVSSARVAACRSTRSSSYCKACSCACSWKAGASRCTSPQERASALRSTSTRGGGTWPSRGRLTRRGVFTLRPAP